MTGNRNQIIKKSYFLVVTAQPLLLEKNNKGENVGFKSLSCKNKNYRTKKDLDAGAGNSPAFLLPISPTKLS